MPVPFTVRVSEPQPIMRLDVRGELDQARVSELETMFRWIRMLQGHPNVVLDVSELEFCDSAGWHALERCHAAGATIFGDPACLRRLAFLIKHAHLLPSELHELRGLEPGAAERLPERVGEAA
jgi:ABC-type transporter Mla MlaB component